MEEREEEEEEWGGRERVVKAVEGEEEGEEPVLSHWILGLSSWVAVLHPPVVLWQSVKTVVVVAPGVVVVVYHSSL